MLQSSDRGNVLDLNLITGLNSYCNVFAVLGSVEFLG